MNSILVKCSKKQDGITCDNSDVKVHNDSILEVYSKMPIYVLFEHELKETVICSGINFQIHVWSTTKYTLWYLPSGYNHCILFKDTYLDKCNHNLYVLTNRPGACSNLMLSICEEKMPNLLSRFNMPLFILLEEDNRKTPLNVIKHYSSRDCEDKLLKLESMVRF